MLIQMTVEPAEDFRLMALRDALKTANVRVEGEPTQLDDMSVQLCVVAACASDVSRLCADLVDRRLAGRVSVQRLDVLAWTGPDR